MKTLLLKTSCFLAALLAIKLAFVVIYGDKFIYPKVTAGGNPYEVEYRRSEFAKEPYDTVFVGSSRTALGISPAYFDKLTGKTKSYNFGIIGGKPPLTFDVCAELMETKASLKYVFFELSWGLPEETDDAGADDRALTFFKPSVPRREYETAYRGAKMPLQNIPLDKFLGQKSRPAVLSKVFSFEVLRREQELNTQFVEGATQDAGAPLDKEYWARVSALIALAEAKGIKILFFIPPRIKSARELDLIRPIYLKLDARYRFRVAHFDESLYQAETSMDNTHLNHEGAKKFTELMAEAFAQQAP